MNNSSFKPSPSSGSYRRPLSELVPPGVVTGDRLRTLYAHALEHDYRIPSFCCSSSIECNSILRAARLSQSPVLLRISHASGLLAAVGDGVGGLSSEQSTQKKAKTENTAVAGAVALAWHVRTVAPFYEIPVVLQSETCTLEHLGTWYCEGILPANLSYLEANGEPLFSSHLLNLTAHHNDDDAFEIAARYMLILEKVQVWLELVVRQTQSIPPPNLFEEGSYLAMRTTSSSPSPSMMKKPSATATHYRQQKDHQKKDYYSRVMEAFGAKGRYMLRL